MDRMREVIKNRIMKIIKYEVNYEEFLQKS